MARPVQQAAFAPNWFIAVPVEAGEWYERIVTRPPDGFRKFHPDDLHMTVAFLGAVGHDKALAAWRALAWDLGTVHATLGTVVPMGAPRRYSALSIELDRGRAEIERAIAATRDACCDAAGARRESRPAKAHITIARPSRNASDADRAAGLRWASQLSLAGQSITLRSVALYTWAEDRRVRQFRIVDRIDKD
jgi:2'-5' RNA ligase